MLNPLTNKDIPKPVKLCTPCHYLVKTNQKKVGPNLWNVYDNYVTIKGLQFGKWTEETLNSWIEEPQRIKPLTKMIFPGVKDPEQRKIIIDYMKTLRDKP
ncbi:MAG: hypothetical protein HQK84_01820 [Nitrospinae bacterium]|nr:hypothetical protein [Nitrospinota bacterium]